MLHVEEVHVFLLDEVLAGAGIIIEHLVGYIFLRFVFPWIFLAKSACNLVLRLRQFVVNRARHQVRVLLLPLLGAATAAKRRSLLLVGAKVGPGTRVTGIMPNRNNRKLCTKSGNG